tara:strand:- start:404 stop:844 length:441 start_codon:yes stop_codon:yes gene_type:complete
MTEAIYNDLSLLFARRKELKQNLNDIQSELKVIDNTITEMFEQQADHKLAMDGKDFGQVSIKDGDYIITYNKRKKVEWDQGLLKGLLDCMDPETASFYAKAVYSVPEAKFQNAPPEVRSALSECRTVMLQGVSIDIKEDKDADHLG